MNGACIDRFCTWFAYHLSNFQFRWHWEDWAPALTMDPLHPKPKFIRETLIRCMRLSYHGKVVEMVPESFKPLLPEVPEAINKYADAGDEADAEREVVRQLLSILTQSKSDPSKVTEVIGVLRSLSEEDEATPLKVEVFSNVLLNYSSQSFSHLFAALGRYRSQLQALTINDECQMALLKTLFNVWRKHQQVWYLSVPLYLIVSCDIYPQLLVVAVEKFLKADIVDCHSVANWIFSPEMSKEIMKYVLRYMLTAPLTHSF